MITGIILASGFSHRMGEDKLLLKVKGTPMLERVIKVAHSSQLDELILIYRRDAIKEIAKKYGVKTIYNNSADEGQSAAVRLGVSFAHPDTEGFMFLVGDQPCLNASTINKLIAVFKKEKTSIVVPVYNGIRGNPVIFPLTLKNDLLGLKGDCGGRIIIDRMKHKVKMVSIKKTITGIDIDTSEEYKRLR